MVEATELTVQGQSLQSLYTQYAKDTFLVNRRYQRKLVWAVDEKERLIDSIIAQLPIPLILLAEHQEDRSSSFEIIDGLQRLNAIFAFIENEFSYEGAYFDLESLADTKYLRDSNLLVQKTPTLPRSTCLAIVNYQLPISIYRSATESSVDEVFRRINSSGRKLSLQEIRQAGVTSSLANLVRRLSAGVRGDATLTDILPLKEMPKISITSRNLPYGIADDSIFWVKNGILDKDSVRESRDEELVLDLLLDILIRPLPVTGSVYRNAAYGRDVSSATSLPAVESRIKSVGIETISNRFVETLDIIRKVVDLSGSSLATWMITQSNPRGIPRYFHALFIALHDIQFQKNMVVDDFPGLTDALHGFWDRELTITGGGGNWSGKRKEGLNSSVIAQLEKFFKRKDDAVSVRKQELSLQFEMEMNMALTESAMFELKQGFTRMDATGALDETSFAKVLRTASAMANRKPGVTGYIFFGVADQAADAQRIEQLYGISGHKLNQFIVTGTQHEMDLLDRSVDDHYRWLVQQIRNSDLEQDFANSLAESLQPFHYRDYLLWSMNPVAMDHPTSFGGDFYYRRGNSTEIAKGPEVVEIFKRFS
ncbi:hypothetical protein AOZ07_03375 [Glutamicibacter halophytocola]|uniref:DUF262 domain-containing protein n=1 Tax=Glutamicibacter halophytocola TaxID=1933880 RepID=UPI0006D4A3F9|nr:DUF262 domain-containing protein [Glutamicibacter halophytocola]ALG28130.1 hypothetical protein AOZ07_03375 [Glutamicibacter halophytocola]